jgi:hypothetical protein
MDNTEQVVQALRAILEIGKRDLSNPKYDAYFDSAKEALRAHDAASAEPVAALLQARIKGSDDDSWF